MGAGVAVGALGAMMLPKNSDAYRMTKQVAKAIQNEAEKAVDAINFILRISSGSRFECWVV